MVACSNNELIPRHLWGFLHIRELSKSVFQDNHNLPLYMYIDISDLSVTFNADGGLKIYKLLEDVKFPQNQDNYFLYLRRNNLSEQCRGSFPQLNIQNERHI